MEVFAGCDVMFMSCHVAFEGSLVKAYINNILSFIPWMFVFEIENGRSAGTLRVNEERLKEYRLGRGR